MLIALVLATSVAPQYIKAADLLSVGFQVPMDMFYLAALPSGAMFCSDKQRRNQTKAFDKRYGMRFNKLIRAVRSRDGLGWPPDQIITTPCYRTSPVQARSMLKDFDAALTAYEAKYGLIGNDR